MTPLVIRTSTPPPLAEHLSPLRLCRSLWANRQLIASFSSRELLERHKGALLGVAWNVLSPLLTLAVYTVVFGYIFGQRWDRGDLPKHFDFPLVFFAGHIFFHVFAESANRAPVLVSGRPNLVRKVVFPLEILPVTVVWSGVIHALLSVGLLLAVLGLVTMGRGLHWHILLAPLVFVPLILISVGVSWFLSAIGVFLRDMRHIILVITQLLMFSTPLFYSVERIPPERVYLRWFIEHNPLSVIVESGRRVLLWGELPNFWALGGATVFGLLVAIAGHAVFSALRRSMADVH